MKIEEIYGKIKKLVGSDKVSQDPVVLGLHSVDAVSFPLLPKDLSRRFIIVSPESSREISEIVKLCYKEKIPVIPQGAATSLALGSSVISITSLNQFTQLEYGVIIYTGRMRRVIEFSRTDRYIIAEAGIRIEELNEYLEMNRSGLFFPVDPASSKAATLGGAIASGAGGLRGARYGTMRDWVLGLEFVDGLGRIHRIGCRTVKCRQGYDMVRLLVGSEGTLGIISSAILKLWPKPKSIARLLYYSDSFEKAFRAFLDLREEFGVPLISEYMSDKIVEKVKEVTGIYFGEGHAIITDFELERSSQADEIFRRAVEILSRHGIKSYYMATDRDPDFDKIYQLRRSMYPATVRARKMKYIIIEDVVVPISRIQDYLNTLESISTRYAREIYVGGHIGDGNLHPKFEGDLEDPKDRDLVLKMGREIALEAVRLGGSVSAEHGIGTMKIELLREEFRYRESEHTLNLMREIKKTFDPGGILNPGRVIPIEK